MDYIMNELRKAAEMALEVLEEICNCPRWVDEATIPKAGIDAAPQQVILNMSVSLIRLRKAQTIIESLSQALEQPEPEPMEYTGNGVEYTGNGTAGREANVQPTGFFFQVKKPVGVVYGWHGYGRGQPLCNFDVTEDKMPVGTLIYTETKE